ncbi:MAG: nucleotidyl transferase AbiEii/AbiGii toxin family protein, partial [Candidatus Jacksonbacteria bacterium]|nr:nucleotidyl transferase AbiEii/AbiGii toxin family protein [Candidatus Jacksonbacteria bacterium]
EYAQYHVLEFIYSRSSYQKLIFTGGSCARIFFGLNRLSEDIDLDASEPIDKSKLAQDLVRHFKKDLQYKNIEMALKGQKEKIYLKLPVLFNLGLAQRGESEKLYVKVEIDKPLSKKFAPQLTPVAQGRFSFFVRHYDEGTLMAGKIIAIIKRVFAKGKGDEVAFKGRDYYDLLWYMQKEAAPNQEYLHEALGLSNNQEIWSKLDERVAAVKIAYLKEDIENLFDNKKFVDDFADNFKELYARYKEKYTI